jgi:mannose/cellobiose epimerase-like protein (N-acyl-D-glucosamine 2-epimerase family)
LTHATASQKPVERSLARHAQDALDWFNQDAAPIWFANGIDRTQGGFYDALDPQTAENVSDRKRLRVVSRQIYVFAMVARLGHQDGEAAVLHGLKFLFTRARHADGGFLSSFDNASAPVNQDRDTYDLAFVLFALAHAYDCRGDEKLRFEAEELIGFFETRLRHPLRGFVEGIPAGSPRRQNPHMHLLEACIAWFPFDRTGVFHQVADEIVLLLQNVFLDPESGAILEYFDDTLSAVGGEPDGVVEPGHLFEWYWLLTCYANATGKAVACLPLIYNFAHKFGKNHENGLLLGELSRSGIARQRSVRLWPHAEWVRAEIAKLASDPAGDINNLQHSLSALWRFLETSRRGLWFDRYDSQLGALVVEPAPASSFYHIVGAFSALIDAYLPQSADRAHLASRGQNVVR